MRAREQRRLLRIANRGKERILNSWKFLSKWCAKNSLALNPPCHRQGRNQYLITEVKKMGKSYIGVVYCCSQCRNGQDRINDAMASGEVPATSMYPPQCRNYPMMSPAHQKELGVQQINAFRFEKDPGPTPFICAGDANNEGMFVWIR